LCAEYGISNDEEDEPIDEEKEAKIALEGNKGKKARMISFLLILASIFMWFMGYNAISSNLSIYITKTLGQSAGIGGIISGVSMGVSAVAFIPVGWLAVKIGRRKSIMLGFGMALISYLLIFFFAATPSPSAVYLYCIFYLIAGFGLIIGNVNTFPMVVELSSNATIGKYTGLYYTATMSAQAITPFIAGLIMDKWGTKYLFLYSVICVLISIALMFFVKHGDSKMVPPKSKLELLGAADD
jgi:MFS family permease